MHMALLAETDFSLGRMDVDVHLVGGHLQKEQHDRIECGRQDVAIGFENGVDDDFVPDEAAVDEDEDGVAVELLHLRLADEAVQAQVAGSGWLVVGLAAPGWRFGQSGAVERKLGGHGQKLVERLPAKDLVDALGVGGYGRGDEDGIGGRVQLPVHLRVGQRVVRDQAGDMRELGGFRLEKLAACRSIEEKIANGDGGSGRQASLFHGEDASAGDLDDRAGGLIGITRFQAHAGDGGNTGHSLTSKAEGGDGQQVVVVLELAGGVALKGQQGVVAHHSAAVIGDLDELAATGFDVHANAGGTCVERVFEQFLDHRGRAFHHLSGGDLVGDVFAENVDAAHV